jgi:hypothetical protein
MTGHVLFEAHLVTSKEGRNDQGIFLTSFTLRRRVVCVFTLQDRVLFEGAL